MSLLLLSLFSLLKKSLAQCGGDFTELSGTISSPGWPGQYPSDSDCTYNIITPTPTNQLQVTWLSLDIEFNAECSYDYLDVTWLDAAAGNMGGGKKCGDQPPEALNGVGGLRLHFVSDGSDVRNGWELNYNIISACNPTPCQNEGTCNEVDGEAVCDCSTAPGWEGESCEIDIDDCASNPCQNDSECRDLLNAFECDCLDGFEGNSCEIELNPCDNDPCHYIVVGGCEKLSPTEFSCQCMLGYEGNLCEIESNPCDLSPCFNEGFCRKINNLEFDCECVNGYEGKHCDVAPFNLMAVAVPVLIFGGLGGGTYYYFTVFKPEKEKQLQAKEKLKQDKAKSSKDSGDDSHDKISYKKKSRKMSDSEDSAKKRKRRHRSESDSADIKKRHRRSKRNRKKKYRSDSTEISDSDESSRKRSKSRSKKSRRRRKDNADSESRTTLTNDSPENKRSSKRRSKSYSHSHVSSKRDRERERDRRSKKKVDIRSPKNSRDRSPSIDSLYLGRQFGKKSPKNFNFTRDFGMKTLNQNQFTPIDKNNQIDIRHMRSRGPFSSHYDSNFCDESPYANNGRIKTDQERNEPSWESRANNTHLDHKNTNKRRERERLRTLKDSLRNISIDGEIQTEGAKEFSRIRAASSPQRDRNNLPPISSAALNAVKPGAAIDEQSKIPMPNIRDLRKQPNASDLVNIYKIYRKYKQANDPRGGMHLRLPTYIGRMSIIRDWKVKKVDFLDNFYSSNIFIQAWPGRLSRTRK